MYFRLLSDRANPPHRVIPVRFTSRKRACTASHKASDTIRHSGTSLRRHSAAGLRRLVLREVSGLRRFSVRFQTNTP